MSILTRKEEQLFVAAGILLCVEILVLLAQMRILPFDFPWAREDTTKGTIGQILEKTNSIKNRSAESLSWYPITKGDAIRTNDLIMTGQESSARIKIEGEAELLLGPDTLISFNVDRSNPKLSVLQIDMDQGHVTFKSGNAPVAIRMKRQNIQIKPQAEIVLTKSSSAKESNVSITKGELAFQNDVEILQFKQGESVKLSEQMVATKIQTVLKVENYAPKNEQRLVLKEHEETVTFEWSGEKPSRIEIDDNPSFSSLRKYPVQNLKSQIVLKPGHYFWRVADHQAIGPISEFTLLSEIHYRVVSPSAKISLKMGVAPQFEWLPVPEASRYNLQVSRSPDFKVSIFEETFTRTQGQMGQLEAGKYYWRIQAEHETLGTWPFSEVFSFSVKEPLKAPTIKGFRRLKKTENLLPFNRALFAIAEFFIPTAYAEEIPKLEVLIEWEEVSGAKNYLFQIAEDGKFQNIIHSKKISTTSISIELPEHERYFWRIAGIDSDDELGPYSKVQTILFSELVPPEVKPKEIPKELPKPIAKKTEIEKPKTTPEPRFNGVQEVSLGISGQYFHQTTSAQDMLVENQGLPLGRLEVKTSLLDHTQGFYLSAWYEPRKIVSNSSIPSEIQPDLKQKEYGAELFLTLDRFKKIPISIGLQYSHIAQFIRKGPEQISLRPVDIFSFIGGPSFIFGDRPYFKMDLFLEATPIGDVKGIALSARSSFAYPRYFYGLTPELHAGIHPSYYLLRTQNQKMLMLNFSLGASLGWDLAL